jgi:muconolactone delta-isomerase
MKFLTISKMKDTASTMPPSVMRQLMEATVDVMNQEKKAGNGGEHYFIPGWDRVVAINEVKSAEEILQRLNRLPIGGFLDFEVYPLVDAFEAMRTYVESMKAAEKMFPGPTK